MTSVFHLISALPLDFLYIFFLQVSVHLRELHSFPTRRSSDLGGRENSCHGWPLCFDGPQRCDRSRSRFRRRSRDDVNVIGFYRSEEHTSELQSRGHLVCRLLLEKKKTQSRPSRCHSRTSRFCL